MTVNTDPPENAITETATIVAQFPVPVHIPAQDPSAADLDPAQDPETDQDPSEEDPDPAQDPSQNQEEDTDHQAILTLEGRFLGIIEEDLVEGDRLLQAIPGLFPEDLIEGDLEAILSRIKERSRKMGMEKLLEIIWNRNKLND